MNPAKSGSVAGNTHNHYRGKHLISAFGGNSSRKSMKPGFIPCCAKIVSASAPAGKNPPDDLFDQK
jgi:hypothetical protein